MCPQPWLSPAWGTRWMCNSYFLSGHSSVLGFHANNFEENERVKLQLSGKLLQDISQAFLRNAWWMEDHSRFNSSVMLLSLILPPATRLGLSPSLAKS